MMKVTMLLADSVQAVQGKLYILGGGWSLIGPDPTPMALAIKIEVPWEQANFRHQWKVELLDADDQSVTLLGPDGPQPIELSGDFEVGRPTGLKVGTPLDLPLAINLGPLQLKPDQRYVWRLLIDEKPDDNWRVAFTTRPARQPTHG